MRSRFVPALWSLALLGSIGPELGAQGRGQDTRPGIAVLPFDNSGSYGQDKENFDALQKGIAGMRSDEHTSELHSTDQLVCRLLLEKKKQKQTQANRRNK